MERKLTENPFLFLIPLILFTIAVFLPTASSLVEKWTNPDNRIFSHGLLLLGVSIFFIYRTWARNKLYLRLRPSFPASGTAFLLSLIWFIAWIGNIQTIQFLILILIIICLFTTILGAGQARLFLFPLLINMFSIPGWEILTVYLRTIAAHTVGVLLNAVNILSVVEGFVIQVRAGSFLVDAGCAGLGQFITALSIGFIYVFMQPMHWLNRIILIVFAAIIAVLTNIIRIFIVVVSGNLTGMQHYFVTVEHVSLGWGIFAIGITFYLYFAGKTSEYCSRILGNRKPPAEYYPRPEYDYQTGRLKPAIIFIVTLLAVSGGPLLAHIYREPDNKDRIPYINLPNTLDIWSGEVVNTSYYQLEPEIPGADIHKRYRYVNPANQIVELNVYHYYWQHQGREAINKLNKVYQQPNWKAVSREMREVTLVPDTLSVEETLLESWRGDNLLVWKWYSVNGVWTGDELRARLLNIWGILTHRPEMSVFVIAMGMNESSEFAFSVLRDFTSSMQRALIAADSGILTGNM